MTRAPLNALALGLALVGAMACAGSDPCNCSAGGRDPARGKAFVDALFSFADVDASSEQRVGEIEAAENVTITYVTDDGHTFRATYEKRGISVSAE